jgi:DNA-binding NarL/FixJ family response regulator
MQTSILIADGHRLVREGLRILLSGRPDFAVVAEADDGREALELALAQRPHVAVIDTQISRLPAVEVVRRIGREGQGTRCILLSAHETSGEIRQAFLAGAKGFVPKSATTTELIEGIRRVRAGGSYLAPSVADCVIGVFRCEPEGSSRGALLSSRQREVLQLIAEGLSTRQIAVELGISIKTARTHREVLMQKVGVHKASDLVRFAIREGLVAA